jgi:hypothetical protein
VGQPVRSEARGDREIIADIMQACDGRATLEIISRLAGGVRQLKQHGPLPGFRKANKKYLHKVRDRLNGLETALRDAPEGFPFLMLLAPYEAATLDEMYAKAENRWDYLAEELGWLRARINRLIETGIGEHGAAGYQQERAAVASAELMHACGLPLAYSSPTSPYRKVAGLFFEVMTGEQGHDLERACEAMAQVPIRTESV